MIENLHNANGKPCLVAAKQGFSVLYNNKFLYSKYTPKATIQSTIQNLQILPETLILCYSPVAGYGIEELLNILPPKCFILGIELNKDLFDFSIENIPSEIQENNKIQFSYLSSPNEIANLLTETNKIPLPGSFRRCLPIQMSGGTQFNEEGFKTITKLTDDFIGQFWKNRLTLVSFGRLFSSNMLKNIRQIGYNSKVIPLENKINKPILVVGAGTSLENTIPHLSTFLQKNNNRQNIYILAVDAALRCLYENKITPDSIVAVESQLAIEKAYIGFADSKIPIIADICSRPSVTRITKGNISYFASEYTVSPFFNRFKNKFQKLNIPVIPALGSVGLAALEIALLMRKTETPVFITGLDFAYIPSKTHACGTPVHVSMLSSTDRIHTTENPASAYKQRTFTIENKTPSPTISQKKVLSIFTDPALYNYAAMLSARYSNIDNIFDIGNIGVKTGIKLTNNDNLYSAINNASMVLKNGLKSTFINIVDSDSQQEQEVNFDKKVTALIKENALFFIDNEHKTLCKIKEILTNGNGSDKEKESLTSFLLSCGYLYDHFPDAALGLRMEADFLKRVRAELNYFIKMTDLKLIC